MSEVFVRAETDRLEQVSRIDEGLGGHPELTTGHRVVAVLGKFPRDLHRTGMGSFAMMT